MLPGKAESQASPRPTGPEGAAGDFHVLGALPWQISGAGLERLKCPQPCRREHRSLFGGETRSRTQVAHGWPLAQLPATGRSATGWPSPQWATI